jgi:hypothetical protein
MTKTDELPKEVVAQIIGLIRSGQKQEASHLLEQYAISKKWKSFEVHHMAQHLLKLSRNEVAK